MKILVVTNDFPPRIGGINDYVDRLVRRLTHHDVTVFSSTYRGAAEHDRTYPARIVRADTTMMLPTPRIRRQLHDLMRGERPDIVLFGAAWPLGHLGPEVRRHFDVPYGAFAHGLELTGAQLPGVLRHIGTSAAFVTAVSDWARRKLAPAFAVRDMPLLPSGVDAAHFRPDVDDTLPRRAHSLGEGPVVSCVSRLVPRKGQDVLIDAWPDVVADHPAATLLIVGHGPYDAALKNRAARSAVSRRIAFSGAVSYANLPSYFRVGDVFAMPCRARWFGFDIEALGAVFLQGAAVGRAVIAGNSGGAPETVRDGITGCVVDPHDTRGLARTIVELLHHPDRREAMGRAGAAWIRDEWTWDAMAQRLDGLLLNAVR